MIFSIGSIGNIDMGVIDDWGIVKFVKWLIVVKVFFRWWGYKFLLI